ncbi:MAG: lipoyl synthase [Planctomycetota bacterium]
MFQKLFRHNTIQCMILPEWLKVKKPPIGKSIAVNKIIKRHQLHTVCQNARCPNIFECFAKGTATFLILGDTCTRYCRFCSIKKLKPMGTINQPSDEPQKVARACKEMKLKHIVITSVTRDDLPDGGASIFYETILEVKEVCPDITIEVLTPDFQGKEESINKVVSAEPDIFNHNIETVPRLYTEIRPLADYKRSLKLLSSVKHLNQNITTKSGLMLGLGEEKDEIINVMINLRKVNCDVITMGQYLRPSLNNKTLEVKRFIPPEEFYFYRQKAYELGFKAVASGPFVRSSYAAEELFKT